MPCPRGACRGWLVVLVCDSPIIAKLRLFFRKPTFAVFHGQPPIAHLTGSIDNQRPGYRHQVRICPFQSVSVRSDIALSATLRVVRKPAFRQKKEPLKRVRIAERFQEKFPRAARFCEGK